MSYTSNKRPEEPAHSHNMNRVFFLCVQSKWIHIKVCNEEDMTLSTLTLFYGIRSKVNQSSTH